MASDGSVIIDAKMNTSKAEKDLAKLRQKIENAEKPLNDKKIEQSGIRAELETAKNEAKLTETAIEDLNQRIAELQQIGEMAGIKNPIGLKEAMSELKAQETTLNAQDKVVERLNAKYAKITDEITKSESELKNMKTQAGQLQESIDAARTPAGKLSEEFDSSSNSLDRLGKRISGLAKRVFVFTLITAALRKFREYLSNVLKTNDEAQAAFARLRGALLTLAQPLIELLIPALTALANILTVIVSAIASLISGIFGKTAKQSADSAKGLYEETQALEGVSGAAEDAAGSLAGFDEINTIQTEDSKGGGGGGAAATMPDFTLDSNISDRLKKIADLVMLIAAGLALWKLSKILPDGLGKVASILAGLLLTVGGLLLFWDGLSDAWENGVDWTNLIEMIGGLAAAALGLYLLFGPIAAGIALVVGGLVMLVTAFHDAMESGWNLQNTLLAIAGLFAAGLGIAILTNSWIPLLIAGIAALLLALTNATGHGEEMLDGIREVIQGFKDFFVGIFTGDISKAILGIEEVVQGLENFVFSIISGVQDSFNSFLTWLDEKTGGKLHQIIEFIRGLFNGLFTFVKDTLGSTFSSLKQILKGITEFISGVFSGDWDRAWRGIGDILKGILNGAQGVFAAVVNAIIRGLNWVISKLNSMTSIKIPDWVPGIGGKGWSGLNLQPISEWVPTPLAQGAVIPPNREFLALLGDQKRGTNIEAPLDTIKQAVIEAMRSTNTSGGREIVVKVMLDKRVIATAVADEFNSMVRETGRSPFNL